MDNEKINLIEKAKQSILMDAMKFLSDYEYKDSNSVLTYQQVNGINMMDWARNVYPILQNSLGKYADGYLIKIISGEGRGRNDMIKIAQAINKENMEEEKKSIIDKIEGK